MDIPVDLNDQFRAEAGKVCDVGIDEVLATEFGAADCPITKCCPEDGFLRGLIRAHGAGIGCALGVFCSPENEGVI
jgi:hypothetical protein